MKKFISKLLYPYRCPFCGKLIKGGICSSCQQRLEFIKEPYCLKCGRAIRDVQRAFCPDCEKRTHYFDAGRGLFVHKEPVSTALYNFKFHNQRYMGEVFGLLLARRFGACVERWNVECVVPVPLGAGRYRRRGFNQAEEIARPFAEAMKIPLKTDLLYRCKETLPSKYLTPKERRNNLREAFGVTAEVKAYSRILLIDDIYTTGATVSAISRKLKNEGVEAVFFLTASIGQ